MAIQRTNSGIEEPGYAATKTAKEHEYKVEIEVKDSLETEIDTAVVPKLDNTLQTDSRFVLPDGTDFRLSLNMPLQTVPPVPDEHPPTLTLPKSKYDRYEQQQELEQDENGFPSARYDDPRNIDPRTGLQLHQPYVLDSRASSRQSSRGGMDREAAFKGSFVQKDTQPQDGNVREDGYGYQNQNQNNNPRREGGMKDIFGDNLSKIDYAATKMSALKRVAEPTPRDDKDKEQEVDRITQRNLEKWELLKGFDAENESVEALALLMGDLQSLHTGRSDISEIDKESNLSGSRPSSQQMDPTKGSNGEYSEFHEYPHSESIRATQPITLPASSVGSQIQSGRGGLVSNFNLNNNNIRAAAASAVNTESHGLNSHSNSNSNVRSSYENDGFEEESDEDEEVYDLAKERRNRVARISGQANSNGGFHINSGSDTSRSSMAVSGQRAMNTMNVNANAINMNDNMNNRGGMNLLSNSRLPMTMNGQDMARSNASTSRSDYDGSGSNHSRDSDAVAGGGSSSGRGKQGTTMSMLSPRVAEIYKPPTSSQAQRAMHWDAEADARAGGVSLMSGQIHSHNTGPSPSLNRDKQIQSGRPESTASDAYSDYDYGF